MYKQVLEFKDIKERILSGVRKIADPVRQTISPKGRNVIFQNNMGGYNSTNDGVTIAKSIAVKDEVENAVISIIKSASLQSNSEAGDGTSTTILLSSILITEGLKLVEDGMNPMDVKKQLDSLGAEIIRELNDRATPVKTDDEILRIANISSNSDSEIAGNVLRIAKVAGTDGLVMIDANNGPKTEIEEELGFIIESGLTYQELRNHPSEMVAIYKDVPVFITDKRIYHAEEAEAILKFVLQVLQKRAVVVVARDFIGKAPQVFLKNHTEKIINVLMVKDSNISENSYNTASDLATFLGGKVVLDKSGTFVNNLKPSDFVTAEKVMCDVSKTVITSSQKDSPDCKKLVKSLKSELEKSKDDESLKKRIASLTNGMVTLKVGGGTPIEINEKIFRYDDAVNAVRASIKDGYLIGGGLTMLSIIGNIKVTKNMERLAQKVAEANIRQIALNCGEDPDKIIASVVMANAKNKKKWLFGYNANKGGISNLLEDGVIDPKKVTEMAIRNAISVAGQIISSNFMILSEEDEVKSEK